MFVGPFTNVEAAQVLVGKVVRYTAVGGELHIGVVNRVSRYDADFHQSGESRQNSRPIAWVAQLDGRELSLYADMMPWEVHDAPSQGR